MSNRHFMIYTGADYYRLMDQVGYFNIYDYLKYILKKFTKKITGVFK